MAANLQIVVVPPTPWFTPPDDWPSAQCQSQNYLAPPVIRTRSKRSNSAPTGTMGLLHPAINVKTGSRRDGRPPSSYLDTGLAHRSGRAYIRSSLRHHLDSTNTNVMTTEVLIYWANTIRNELVPRIVKDGMLPSEHDMTDFRAFLEQLAEARVTADMLRRSRIHFALMELDECDGWWSSSSKQRADVMILGWEGRFGDLRDLTIDPWAEGGCMANVFKLKDVSVFAHDEPDKATWVVQRSGKDMRFQALKTGHIGFEVGQWWVKPAAACRDGIIDNCDGITADTTEAFAIVLTDADEKKPTGLVHLRYCPSWTQPNRVKLMRNLATRNPVRVLRRHKLVSPYSPEVGLRYDGLYIVKGHSVTAHPDRDNFALIYTFKMERIDEQDPLEIALHHPTVEEKDEWNAYQRHKHAHVLSHGDLDPQKDGQFVVKSTLSNSVFRSRHPSGFFSEDILVTDGGYFAAAPHQDAQDTPKSNIVSPGDDSDFYKQILFNASSATLR